MTDEVCKNGEEYCDWDGPGSHLCKCCTRPMVCAYCDLNPATHVKCISDNYNDYYPICDHCKPGDRHPL